MQKGLLQNSKRNIEMVNEYKNAVNRTNSHSLTILKF